MVEIEIISTLIILLGNMMSISMPSSWFFLFYSSLMVISFLLFIKFKYYYIPIFYI